MGCAATTTIREALDAMHPHSTGCRRCEENKAALASLEHLVEAAQALIRSARFAPSVLAPLSAALAAVGPGQEAK